MSAPGWQLQHSYAQLPAPLHALVQPTAVAAPRMVIFNADLAETLGLDVSELDEPQRAALFSGNRLPPGAKPLAQAYAGHQFGHFTMLGDGRAILLGEVLGPDGIRRDIQLKGSGPTPYSRMGDGRAWMGPVLREYVVSEAMHALGIPTTRALAAVATGEDIWREQGALPGAVLTRVARSHLRVGTFQVFAHRGEVAALALETYVDWLADFVERLAPEQVLHRLTGDAPEEQRLAPRWGVHKNAVRERLAAELRVRGSRQGSRHGAGQNSAR